MKVNLIDECNKADNKEFYYGAMLNKNIKDVYMGYGLLEPKEIKKVGPPKGHEEIIMLLNGEMMISLPEEDVLMKKGDAVHIPEGNLVQIENLTDEKIGFMVAGGHPVPHSHGHSH